MEPTGTTPVGEGPLRIAVLDPGGSGNARRLQICGEATIYSALSFKSEMLTHLQESPRLEIALDQVTDIDTAGLQVLLMLIKEAARTNKALVWTSVSAKLSTLVGTFHLGAYLKTQVGFSENVT